MSDDNPFALLGLPQTFDLDSGALHRAWLRASARLHPDRLRDPVEQAEAATRIAAINTARQRLIDDEQRAAALLDLLGGPSASDEKGLPDGFLMEILEVREAMEEAAGSSDPADRERFEVWARAERLGHVDRVKTAFASAGADPDESMRHVIPVELNAWRYIGRMSEQLGPGHEPIL